jgi:mannose-6-phosphate isomerase
VSESIDSRAPARRARTGDRGRVRPVVLGPNQLARFYAGGERIDRLRGRAVAGGGGPEDWVASTTTVFGDSSEGLSRLPDGRPLRDAIESDPVGFLGPGHVRRWGADPGLLVKLLDAGERLPVHVHPGRRFAREVLGLAFGKTEAWVIIDAQPGAVVHLGLKVLVTRAKLAHWVAEQDVAAMLGALHELPVRAGDVVFVPAGTLHAIGAGILMVELQEPTDLSVLLEWQRFGVDDGVEHLNLGWERALEAVDLGKTQPGGLLVERPSTNDALGIEELLPRVAAPYFRAQRIVIDGEPVHLEASFAILVVLDGSLTLCDDRGPRLELAAGVTALVPFGAGQTTLDGHAMLIRCLPPLADAGVGQW